MSDKYLQKNWCTGFAFTPESEVSLKTNGWGSCIRCKKWVRSTKTGHPFHHKSLIQREVNV